MKHKRSYFFLFFVLVMIIMSCREENEPAPVSERETINHWIYDNMKRFYLWSDSLPVDPDFTIVNSSFYRRLIFKDDRFSSFYENSDALNNLLNGIDTEAGYEYRLIRREPGSKTLYAAILYTKNNSPADRAGIQRGDLIKTINGQELLEDNFRTLTSQLRQDHTVVIERYNDSLGANELLPPFSIETEVHKENPNFLDTIYTLNSGSKVGYFVYNFFDDGDIAQEYNDQMDEIFGGFKSNGVNEIVIDFRYNGGGFISSASNLASLLTPSADESDVFCRLEYFKEYQAEIVSEQGEDILIKNFDKKPQNIGGQISSSTIYFLVSNKSASASELVINGLSPYINVVLVGKKTVGKNVGSRIITDEENESNPIGLLPVVLRLQNANGFSDYGQGFVPDYEVEDFQLPLKQLGDINEPLLAQAIALINGEEIQEPVSTRVGNQYEELYNTLKTSPLIID